MHYRENCHFLTKSSRKASCAALAEFYNNNNDDCCGKCPFFKTDEDFNRGWNRRLIGIDGIKFTEAV